MHFEKVVLITGGSGLVGKNLEMLVKEENSQSEKFIFLSSKDANLEILEEVRNIFEKYMPDYVINLAANVGGLFKNLRQNLQILSECLELRTGIQSILVLNLVEVKKCISCLSTCIFPDNTPYPIDETMIHNGPPSNTNYGYSYAKRYIDILNRALNEDQSDTLFTSIVPCNIYGMYDNFNLADGHVIPCLIHKAYKSKRIVIFNPKTRGQILLYLAQENPCDLARLIRLVLSEYDSPNPIILSTDEDDEISIGEASEHIRKYFNISKNIKLV
ncbi:hypothetical protein HZS_1371 [Henneguya salminicola]|nr:hypothetical protein HZS_1371 [Henneguya salminicola]